jgi:uncharacterized protein (DUF1501 family)
MNVSRRFVLGGTSALVALGGGLRVAFADSTATSTPVAAATTGTGAGAAPANPILVVVFCRFGQDGMQLVAPAGDPNYIQARPTIRIQTSGGGAGLGLGTLQGVDMYMHPSMPELKALYDAKQLAAVVAAGVPTASRSHFQVQDLMERGGADGTPVPQTGWLARHMASIGASGAASSVLSTIAVSTNVPTSLTGDSLALAVPNPQSFTVGGNSNITAVSSGLVTGQTDYELKAQETITAIGKVQAAYKALTASSPATPTGYTGGDLSTPLRALAQLIKMNVGISVATVDMGGWDHHQNLVPNFQNRATELSRSIGAFWKDVSDYQSQITLITMTEFGRRFQENANHGLDHGSASTMLVLGSAVAGGQIFGTWPGLAANQLYGGDLAVTTDYRQVIGEVIAKRHGETAVASVMGVPYQPLGLFP